MRKTINMILAIALSLSLIGCKGSIVLEENTKNIEELKNFEVVETPVEITKEWVYPSFFEGDKIYGADLEVSTENGGSNVREYYIDTDGKYNIINSDKFFTTEIKYTNKLSYVGITKSYDEREVSELEKEYYYRDNLNDITVKVEGLNDLINDIRLDSDEYVTWNTNGIQDNKYIYIDVEVLKNRGGYLKKNVSEQIMYIINSETGEISISHNKSEDEEGLKSAVFNIYYDKNLESLMAITIDHKVKKINIKNNKILFEEYRELNLQGYELYFIFNMNEVSKDKIIFQLVDESVDMNTINSYKEVLRCAVYNTLTGEVELLDDDMWVTNVFGKNNLLTLSYNNDAYLAQIQDNNEIEFKHKFDKGDGVYIDAMGVINEEGNRIFITKRIADTRYAQARFEYSFIDLK